MESYFAAKRRLFEMLPDGAPAIVNLDDPRGASAGRRSHRATVTYAIDAAADVTPGPFELSLSRGSLSTARRRGGRVRVRSPLVGRPNVYNILAAVATGVGARRAVRAIEDGIASTRPAFPGRFQLVSAPQRRRCGGRRLRAHRRCAEEPARNGTAAGRGPDDDRVRVRRRSRSHEAAADGRRRGAHERSGRGHVRQSAQRRSGANHRGNQARHVAGGRARAQGRRHGDVRSWIEARPSNGHR